MCFACAFTRRIAQQRSRGILEYSSAFSARQRTTLCTDCGPRSVVLRASVTSTDASNGLTRNYFGVIVRRGVPEEQEAYVSMIGRGHLPRTKEPRTTCECLSEQTRRRHRLSHRPSYPTGWPRVPRCLRPRDLRQDRKLDWWRRTCPSRFRTRVGA